MNNEPAFPVSTRPSDDGLSFGHQDSPSTWQYGGMTLRDYFAAKTIQRFISTNALERGAEFNISLEDNERLLAEVSYRIADAMLKARSNG